MSRLGRVLLVALLGVPAGAVAGVSLVTDGELLADAEAVAAVTVEDVEPEVGTQGDPPRVTLRIHTVLHGRLASRRIGAVWLPPAYVGGLEGEAPPRAWRAEPMRGPRRGARMILMLVRSNGELVVPDRCRLTDAPEQRAYVEREITDVTARRRQAVHEYQAQLVRIAARRKSWRRATPAAAIARSTREADLVGVGRLVSGPNKGVGAFQITTVLKGVPRLASGHPAHFADVHIPAGVFDFVERDIDFLLFLSENGMTFGTSSATYLTAAEGFVLADTSAREIVERALAEAPAMPRRPLCMLVRAPDAPGLPFQEGQALWSRVSAVFASAGEQRCNVALNTGLFSFGSPGEAGDGIAALYSGVRQALLVTLGAGGRVTFTGIRIEPGRTEVAFADEPWPEADSDGPATAARFLERLLVRR